MPVNSPLPRRHGIRTDGWGPAVEQALDAVVGVRTEIPEDGFTAGILGTERIGHGVLIDPAGVVLTIGYLVTEAETVWITTRDGKALPAHAMGYDQESGFGLIQVLSRTSLPAIELGTAARLSTGDTLIVAGLGEDMTVEAQLTARQEFAGYWEYVLDKALFTYPAHPHWGGAAAIDTDGRLVGIASLRVQQVTVEGESVDGNMIVPIDLLPPVLDDLKTLGRPNKKPRPWLGFYVADNNGQFAVAGLAEGAPAQQCGVQSGDRIIAVAGHRPESLADLFRTMWSLGGAGVTVPLTVERHAEQLELAIPSAARADFLKGPRVH